MKLKNLLANKNVVTILGAVLLVIVLYGFYMWRVNSAINPISVPYAKVTIGPRTVITNDMIGHVDIQQASIKGKIFYNAERDVINKYTNINVTIPEGSLFYTDLLVTKDELVDSFLIEMPKDADGNYMVAYNYGVNVETTYGNSIYPGNFVDVYFVRRDNNVQNGKTMYGKLATNVKVLAVKDSSGNHVFENMTENRIPNQIILAVTEEMNSLLRVAETISSSKIILVPTNVAYVYQDPEEIVTEISDEDIRSYIEQNKAN